MGKQISKEIGKYLLDISKLTFGGLFLTGITNIATNIFVLVGMGAFAVFFTAYAGFYFIKKE